MGWPRQWRSTACSPLPHSSQYLGELLAIDYDAPCTLAAAVWMLPLNITTDTLPQVA
jgi:hypothetical protein